MTATTPGFVGRRLAQARQARGLTAVSLAEILGISSASISQYEHDKQAPRPELLEKISSALNVPPAFFVTQPLAVDGERATKWRHNSAATKFARERAEVRYEWLREAVHYFSGHLNLLPVRLPEFAGPADFRELTSAQIDAAAAEARAFWDISGPVPNLVRLLESNGVIVARGRLHAEGLDAFSEWLPNDLPYIFLGSDLNVGVRSRFDAAHELGHLVLHRTVSKRQYGKPEDFKLLERQAHRFAAAFLLPKDQFFRELWAPTLDAFAALKPSWKVSIKGMIVHSHRHGLLNDSQYQRAMIAYNRRWRDGEPSDDVTPVEQPLFLARCVDMLIDQKIRRRDEILRDLALPQADLEELVGVPRGYFNDVKAEVIQLPRPTVRQPLPAASGRVVALDFQAKR